jgi:malonate-semialdehyde dehydrogenase (acetylating)/methylmalonate-semialdehyde dehydrogenase
VSNLVAELYAEAGLPEGVFNVVHGDKEAVDALLDHPDVAAISFVGSTPIARYVHGRASAAGKRVQALGGAKNHAVVMPDADLDFTAGQLTSAGYGSAGQRCMAISVVVAVGDVAEPLVERLRAQALDVTVGPGPEPGQRDGPGHHGPGARAHRGLHRGGRAGGRPARGRRPRARGGGRRLLRRPDALRRRHARHVDLPRRDLRPVLSVVHVGTLQEAIELINANAYANGTAIFTSSGRPRGSSSATSRSG